MRYSTIVGLCNQITFLGKITKIDAAAFSKCSNLSSIDLLDTVTFIGSYAFFNCLSLKSFVFNGNIEFIQYSLPKYITYIGTQTFFRCAYLNSIVIPEFVTLIDNLAFGSFERLKSVTYLGEKPPLFSSDSFEETKIEKVYVKKGYQGSSFCNYSIEFLPDTFQDDL